MMLVKLIIFLALTNASWAFFMRDQYNGFSKRKDVDNGCNKKVVCYYPSWAQYRNGSDKYELSSIDTSLCTHLIYSFLVLNEEGAGVDSNDVWLDEENEKTNYRAFTRLKVQNKNLKVLAALGGWQDSQDRKELYKRLFSNGTLHEQFALSTLRFLQKYDFDGLDIDYETPDGHDKPHFTRWVKRVADIIRPTGLQLTIAVSGVSKKLSEGFEMNKLSEYINAFHIMAYDYHGPWEKDLAKHHAPLASVEPQDDGCNIRAVITYLKQIHVPPSKIVLGIPMYGAFWPISTNQQLGITSPMRAIATGDVKRGHFTYTEICKNLKDRSWVKRDISYMAPYAFGQGFWVGYDSIRSTREKMEYVFEEGLAGVMIWELSQDDFNGVCGQGKYPLLSTIDRVIRKKCYFLE